MNETILLVFDLILLLAGTAAAEIFLLEHMATTLITEMKKSVTEVESISGAK